MNYRGQRILIVENDKDSVALNKLSDELSKDGYFVERLSDVDMVLSAISKEDNVVLILIDTKLRYEDDGFETAAKILGKYRIPLIFISSSKDSNGYKKALDIGAYSYLHKDEDFNFLISSIRMSLNFNKGASNSAIEKTDNKNFEFHSDELLDLLLEYSPIYVFFKDSEIRSIRLSANFESMLGRPLDQIIGKTMDELFPSELAKSMIEDDMKILNEGVPIEVMEELAGHTYITKKFPIIREGKEKLLAGFTIDITGLKDIENKLMKSLKEKEILLMEIQDRVKNNLNVISSLIRLEINNTHDEKARDVLNSTRSRIVSMTGIYEKLYLSPNLDEVDLSVYIKELSHFLFKMHALGRTNIRIENDLENIKLDVNRSIPLGIMLNEIISNCLKYAFPENKAGKILIRLKNDNGKIIISVSDDGIGYKKGFNPEKSNTMGHILLLMLSRQIDGKISFENRDKSGVLVTVTFTL